MYKFIVYYESSGVAGSVPVCAATEAQALEMVRASHPGYRAYRVERVS